MQNLIKRNTGPHRHAPGDGKTLAEKLAQNEALLAAAAEESAARIAAATAEVPPAAAPAAPQPAKPAAPAPTAPPTISIVLLTSASHGQSWAYAGTAVQGQEAEGLLPGQGALPQLSAAPDQEGAAHGRPPQLVDPAQQNHQQGIDRGGHRSDRGKHSALEGRPQTACQPCQHGAAHKHLVAQNLDF